MAGELCHCCWLLLSTAGLLQGDRHEQIHQLPSRRRTSQPTTSPLRLPYRSGIHPVGLAEGTGVTIGGWLARRAQ